MVTNHSTEEISFFPSHLTHDPWWNCCRSLQTTTARVSATRTRTHTHTPPHTHTHRPGNSQLWFLYPSLLLCKRYVQPQRLWSHLGLWPPHTHLHTDIKALLTSDLVPQNFPAWILNMRPLCPDLNDPHKITFITLSFSCQNTGCVPYGVFPINWLKLLKIPQLFLLLLEGKINLIEISGHLYAPARTNKSTMKDACQTSNCRDVRRKILRSRSQAALLQSLQPSHCLQI